VATPAAGATTPKIVGGQGASYADWPWAVALYNRGSFVCSASLVRSNWVLTVSHCVLWDLNPQDFTVHAGSASRSDPAGEIIAVKEIVRIPARRAGPTTTRAIRVSTPRTTSHC
jgi:secreted trypsin-like serine protease